MSNLGKYESRHPLRRYLLNRFLAAARRAVGTSATSVLDVGTGEGLFWSHEKPNTLVGIDIRADALRRAQDENGILPVIADAAALPFPDGSFDLVTAIEVLEHLPNPEETLDEMRRVAADRVVISTPWEPWFSLATLAGSGRHPRRLGREPEHIQAFGPADIERMLDRRFSTVEVHTVFPWILGQGRV